MWGFNEQVQELQLGFIEWLIKQIHTCMYVSLACRKGGTTYKEVKNVFINFIAKLSFNYFFIFFYRWKIWGNDASAH